MANLVNWLDQNLSHGANIFSSLRWRAGSFGTSGSQLLLKYKGMQADDAILAVRTARLHHALETSAQEEFVRSF